MIIKFSSWFTSYLLLNSQSIRYIDVYRPVIKHGLLENPLSSSIEFPSELKAN